MGELHTDFVPDIDPVERIRRAMVRFVEAFRADAVMMGLIEQVGTFAPEMRSLRLALRQSFVDRSARYPPDARRWEPGPGAAGRGARRHGGPGPVTR
jgi:hypothetical protein